MKIKNLILFIGLCVSLNANALETCNLGAETLEEEHEWLARLDYEFESELTDVKEIAALDKIPSLVLPISDEGMFAEHWAGVTAVIDSKNSQPNSAKRIAQLERVSERQALWQLAKNGGRAFSSVLDIVFFAPWVEDLTRTMWDDSASELHRLSVTAEPIPFVGFAIGYYDYLSTLDNPEKRLNQWLKNGHYSYGQETVLQRLNTASAESIEHQHEQLKLHIIELTKRLASIQLLHYDATYSAKVLELQEVINKMFSAIDIEYASTMLDLYNRPPHVIQKFGEQACINPKLEVREELNNLGVVSSGAINNLRACSYRMLMGNVGQLYGIGKYPHIDKVRGDILAYKQNIIENAVSHIIEWREKIFEIQRNSIDTLVRDTLNSGSIRSYRLYLYQRARRIAIDNFSLSILQRRATEEEQRTGRFLVGEGELICGVYSCQVYQGREVFFDEDSDPLLQKLSEPLDNIDLSSYINERVIRGWTNVELDEPYINLWQQWQNREDVSLSALPYKGNPSLEVIKKDMPELFEIFEKIPSHLSAEQAKPFLFQLIRNRMFKEDIQTAWTKLGDFIFRFQYEQRQHQSLNFLPLQWQQAIWPSQPQGVLFSAFLDKTYMYYSRQPWAQALPFSDGRTSTTNWTLYQGQSHHYYLTQSVPENVYLGDQYWIEINEQLSHVLALPEIRWRPFEQMILMDIWSQITEIESLVEVSNRL
ncbi:hypothetical protein BTO10_04745 [Vibrio chagasii]|uniref:Uncharacterized protein n=1 Tax=Vibrio chagasii TaxID=170679 RepID=A0A2S7VQH1_9VIBR|nr:hypothetical protein [Vibrio chagasii]PQJ64105.1 hypothetical protein BTO10_04745 [Vibrio chagasii]